MVSLSEDLELLADPLRVRLLALLEGEELTVGELGRVLSLPQPTVSRHLKSLLQGEWLVRRTVGTAAFLRMTGLDATRTDLWRIVRADRALDLEADRDRMARVLAERQADADTFFGRVAAGWDALRDQLFGRRFMAPALGALVPPDATIVDLGCGTGEVLTHLAGHARLIGVDREPGMLAIARQRLGDAAQVIEGALEDVPLPDASADAALLILVLHHLAEPAAVLAEARRILTPNGRLVVVDMLPHTNTTWRTFGHLHQGFSEVDLVAHAATAHLVVKTFKHLPPDPDAQGAPLFVATLGAAAEDTMTLGAAPAKVRKKK